MSEEIRPEERILNCIPSPQPEMDWSLGDAVGARILELPTEIPEAIDLREEWWEIGDQERTGSCVGWATADSVLRWHFVKAGRLCHRATSFRSLVLDVSRKTDSM